MPSINPMLGRPALCACCWGVVEGSCSGGPEARPYALGAHHRLQPPLHGSALATLDSPMEAPLSSSWAQRCPSPVGQGEGPWVSGNTRPQGQEPEGQPQGESAELMLVPFLSFGGVVAGSLHCPPHFLLLQLSPHPQPILLTRPAVLQQGRPPGHHRPLFDPALGPGTAQWPAA